MEYPWHHHHPPPPLYPPPIQPPPPPQPPHHFLSPPPFSHSHNHTPISQLHHQHPNPQSQPNQILNSQFHNQHPSFELSHNRHPGFELLHDQHPGFQLQDPNPSLRLHHHSSNSQFHNQNPSFQPHDRYPSLQSHNQNPNFQPHNQHPSFELLHDRHPGFELLHDQHPDFQLHDRNPSLRPHDQNPSFRLHDQNPSFELLHDQHPSFQLNDRNPSLRLHDQNPSLRLHDQNRSVELLHDQHSSFRLHDHSANIQSHNQNPSFELLHDQHPSVRLHDHSASLRSHDQDPRFELRNRNLGDAYSPFDHGYKRPRPDELGVKEHRLKLIHEHGGNEFMLPNEEIRGNFREDLGLKRPRFDESDLRKRYLMPNLDTHYEIKGLRDSNELSSRVKGEEKPLETRFRSGFEHNHNDTKSNIPLNRDIRSHGYNISPENRTILENRRVALPTSPFMDPKGPLFSDKLAPPLQEKPSSLFPISVTAASPVASSYSPFSEAQNSARPYFHDKSRIQDSNGFPTKELQPIGHRLSMNYAREGQRFPLIPFDKPKALDASQIFKQPHRATRPDHIVVILRGLPGSGKSYLAKMIRDLELENGGMAPRIHSMDDYFMTEVEKVEESDSSKSSGSSRGKKAVVKMVMEYCYEAELEEAYRSSMLKTFKKTLDEGAFPFVIVDDRNLRVADFAQFWAIAKRSGYEVYLLEATYKDPAGCAARNVHNFTLEDIKKMADQWEEAPSMYLKLDAKSLLQGENLKENSIQEVDMDTDDGESEDAQNGLAERYSNILAPAVENLLPSGRSKAVDTLNAESDHVREEVKELGRSKWSKDLEDDDGVKAEFNEGDNANALSAIIKAYKKDGKSVHWGDKAANIGFSIGAAKRLNTILEIGPGSGYNSKSNPLPVELVSPDNNGKSKTQSVFQERMRAERESTRAVFDRRRHRIGGIDSDEE